MEGIIILLLLAILAVPIILLIWVKVSTSSSIQEVLNKLNSLSVQVNQLSKNEPARKTVIEDEVSIDESLLNLMESLPNDEKEKKPKEEKTTQPKPIEKKISEKKIVPTEVKIAEKKPRKKKAAAFIKPKKEKRDIEKFIGENIINKIGIGVLVLGIAYFVRYAIDKNWVNEIGRVAIGILLGGVLTFLAHKIRKAYKAFSSVLVGGAMAVFYYSISIGFHDYQLFSQPVAFGLMVVITGFSVLLSISYDRKELAILGLIGAFSTPLMVSNGDGNYQVLFSYLAIVNVGMLVLAYFKKWNIVNILSLGFTVILYSGWFASKIIDVVNPPYAGAMIFAAIFYITFFFMHIVNNVKEKRKFKGYEFALLITITALFYGVGMSVLYLAEYQQYQGLFTVALGIFNLLFAFPLFKHKKVDKSLIYLLIGIVLTFVSLAAPVQLSGNYITMFWATEMVLLLWLGQKSNIKFIQLSSMIVLVLMLVSLVIDWQQIYVQNIEEFPLAIIVNKGFITTLFSIGGVIVYSNLLKLGNKNSMFFTIKVKHAQKICKAIVASLIYILGVLELSIQIETRIGNEALEIISLLGYTLMYLLCLWIYAKKVKSIVLEKVITAVSALMLIIYPLFNGVERIVRDNYLVGKGHIETFLVQYVNLTLIVIIGFYLLKNIRAWYGLKTVIGRITVWTISILGLIIASTQLNHTTLILFYDQFQENAHFITKQTVKIGFPIIWAITSFIMMLVGMKYKYRTLRIISLSVFSVILLKLFLFDIKGASEAGKIVAFVLLGVLLLVVSFMYQKLKNLLLDNSSTSKTK